MDSWISTRDSLDKCEYEKAMEVNSTHAAHPQQPISLGPSHTAFTRLLHLFLYLCLSRISLVFPFIFTACVCCLYLCPCVNADAEKYMAILYRFHIDPCFSIPACQGSKREA